ncbi:MAG: HEAT repeat domain-containing protein [Chitinophagaceae bacterium]|nr:HEAT repeat domain-containing protein [Chitinophagaceae bacterium]
MAFYDLNKEQRLELVDEINRDILADVQKGKNSSITNYFSDEDTYIRKTAYLTIGKIWKGNSNLHPDILKLLDKLFKSGNEKARQTTINAAGEIGIKEFETVECFFDNGLFDEHHIVRNAVIGSIKKMGEKNPKPVLKWAKKYLHHSDKEVRREICHGIELRGRTHPQDILPLLKELQFDKTARVKNTLVHVLGQIAYKKGCLETVVEHLKSWDNKELVLQALDEIIDVHDRYKDFAILTQEQAIDYVDKHYKRKDKKGST